MTPIVLAVVSKRLSTLDAADNVIKSWTDSDIASSVNYIGEKKRLEIRYSSSVAVEGKKIFFNVALFAEAGLIDTIEGAGTTYWSYAIPSGAVIGTTYDCEFTGGGLFPLQGRNYKGQIKYNSASVFTVIIDFFQTYDTNGYINAANDRNHDRLLKNIYYNPLELDLSGSSVYSAARDARFHVFIQDIENPENSGVIETVIPSYAAKFWGESVHVNDVTFTLSFNGETVTALKKLTGGTDVALKFYSSTAPDRIILGIFRDDTTSNTVDFVENYELERVEVSPGAEGDKISGPYSSSVSGSLYTYNFKIKPDDLVEGASYRMFATIYGTAGVLSTGVGPSTPVDLYWPYDGGGLEFSGRLADCHTQFSGDDLECVVEERMRSILKIDSPNWAANILSRLGLTTTNDLRRYLTKIEFTIYREYTDATLGGTVRNIYLRKISTRSSMGVYTGSDLSLSFSTNFTEFKADWRNRYESAVPIDQTLLNGVNYLPLQDNQYWGGKNFLIDWKLTFFYDNYSSPFTDEIIYTQKIRVKDYEPDVITIEAQNEEEESNDFWCAGDEMCLKAVIDHPNAYTDVSSYTLITNIEPDPGSSSTIEENEEWVPNEMGQKTTTKIESSEIAYSETDPNEAKFCIASNELLLNSPYKVSALAKKYYDQCNRIVETGDNRITEESDQRVPETCS